MTGYPTIHDYLDDVFVAGWSLIEGEGGLHRYQRHGDKWEKKSFEPVLGLSALARHPRIPVLYGLSEGTSGGLLHTWRVDGNNVTAGSSTPSHGVEPCHLAVSPDSPMLAVAHYGDAALTWWRLAENGFPIGAPQIMGFEGSSIDPVRQRNAHLHHVSFDRGSLLVTDLGSDIIRRYSVVEGDSGNLGLSPAGDIMVPAHTGPRHLTKLRDQRIVLSGELNSTVLMNSVDQPDMWTVAASTRCALQQASSRERNYPGDIQSSPDSRYVYVANRGLDTVGVFAVESSRVRLVDEVDSGVEWPQHLVATTKELFVAGRTNSSVVAWELVDGLPVSRRDLFACPGASWIQPWSIC